MRLQISTVLGASVLLLVPATNGQVNNVPEPDPLCIKQADPTLCQGTFNCANSGVGGTECFFWVYDSNCTAKHASDPWPGVRAGDKLTFDNLQNEVVIQNATNDLDKSKISVVFSYGDGHFGDGQSPYARGDCSAKGDRCAFMRVSFPC